MRCGARDDPIIAPLSVAIRHDPPYLIRIRPPPRCGPIFPGLPIAALPGLSDRDTPLGGLIRADRPPTSPVRQI